MLISNCPMPDAVKQGALFCRDANFVSSGSLLLMVRGVRDPDGSTSRQYLDEISRVGMRAFADNHKEEHLVVVYDTARNKIEVLNGHLGRETCYVFHEKGRIVLADDFWELAAVLDDLESRVSVDRCREWALFKRPLFDSTFIHGLEYLPPATILQFDLKTQALEKQQYWSYRYNHSNENLEARDIVDTLERLINEQAVRIRDKYPPSTVFGIGLSGGMDSRLAAYYGQKNGMKLRPYVIGRSKGPLGLRTMSFSAARKVSKNLGLSLTEIHYLGGSFYQNTFGNVRRFPLGAAEYHICRHESLPAFDAYYNGMYGGEMWGQVVPMNIQAIPRAEMPEFLTQRFSYLGKRNEIEGAISHEDYDKVITRLRSYVQENADLSNLNLLQRMNYSMYISRQKGSMFDDMEGKHTCNTVFLNPDLVDFSLTLAEKWIIGLKLQKEFFRRKLVPLAKIMEERPWAAIYYRDMPVAGRVRGYLARMESKLRGAGLNRGEWVKSDQEYIRYAKKVLALENPHFQKAFPGGNFEKLIISPTGHDRNMFRQLVKIKMILDVIYYKKIQALTQCTRWEDWRDLGLYAS